MAKLALDVQDACNLSGVVHSFCFVITDVRLRLREEGKESTEAINSHPVCVLFSSKIQSLTQVDFEMRFHDAYVWAREQTKVNGE